MHEPDPFETLEEGIAYAESAGVNEMTMLRATVAPSMKAALDILRDRAVLSTTAPPEEVIEIDEDGRVHGDDSKLRRAPALSPTARTEIDKARASLKRIGWEMEDGSEDGDHCDAARGPTVTAWRDLLIPAIAALDTVLGSASTKEGK